MQITIEIPDTIAGSLASPGHDPVRAVIEAIAIQEYRTERLSEARLLGFETREETHGFLKQHSAFLPYTVEEAERDTAVALEVARMLAPRVIPPRYAPSISRWNLSRCE